MRKKFCKGCELNAAALAERHDRIVHWEGGPTRVTVLSCRAHVQEEPGGPVYTIPCRWLLEHSEPVAS